MCRVFRGSGRHDFDDDGTGSCKITVGTPVDGENAPMEDGEGGDPCSGRARSSPRAMKCKSTWRLPSLTALGALTVSEEGGGTISTGQEEEGEDQGIIHTSQLTADSSRRTTMMIRQIRGATRSLGAEAKYGLILAMAVEGQCCTMDCEACGGLV